MTSAGSTYDEEAMFFPCGEDHLFGVLTSPRRDPRGVVALLLWGSGPLPSFGTNQIRARLARRLAGSGYHTMRIDYPGVGDSTGTASEGDRLDNPNVEPVLGAASWLRERHLSRTVVVGSCFGARSALASAGRLPDLTAVVLISPPVWDDERDMRPSQRFLAPFSELCERRIPVLFLYGADDHVYKYFRQGRAGKLGQLLEDAGDLVTVRVTEEPLHGFPTASSGDGMIEIVDAWLSAAGEAEPGSLGSLPLFTR